MEKIMQIMSDRKKIIKINNNLFEIVTDTEFESGVPVKIFVKKINDKFYLTDEKNTLRFMNEKYELRSPDVKQCINDIVKYYNFIIEKGELLTEIKSSDSCVKRYNDLIVCSCTLANMFIFFDTPVSN